MSRSLGTEPVVLLGTRSNGLTVLDIEREGSAPPHNILVEWTDDGLSASTWVYEHPGFERLIMFLTGLERDWRGWDGRRDWSSLEGQLSIGAEHTGGRVQFWFELRNMGWVVGAQMQLGAGEDLSNAVRAAEASLT